MFIALGGSSYAALKISGSEHQEPLDPGEEAQAQLDHGQGGPRVAAAACRARGRADRLGGFTADELRIRCPERHVPDRRRLRRAHAARGRRPTAARSSSASVVGTPAGPGRRLPTHGELMAALSAVDARARRRADFGRLSVGSNPGRLDVLYVTDQVGSVALTPNTAAGGKAFRCVTDPLN